MAEIMMASSSPLDQFNAAQMSKMAASQASPQHRFGGPQAAVTQMQQQRAPSTATPTAPAQFTPSSTPSQPFAPAPSPPRAPSAPLAPRPMPSDHMETSQPPQFPDYGSAPWPSPLEPQQPPVLVQQAAPPQTGVDPKRSKMFVVAGVLGVLAVAVGGGYWWYRKKGRR